MGNTNELKEKENEIEIKDVPHRYNYAAVIAIVLSAIIGALVGIMIAGHGKNDNAAVEDVIQQPIETDVPIYSEATPAIPLLTETNDWIDVIAEARKQGMVKRCYLTFDDGPSANVTDEILDVLAKYDIKATFFEVGKSVRTYPEVTLRVYNEGHLIANHSYNHDYSALYASEDAFRAEINACTAEIEAVVGEELPFKLVRFPGGGYNAGSYGEQKQLYKQTLSQMGYYYCDWNVLNGDAEGEKKDCERLIEFFKSSAQRYIDENKNLIVLMHDTDAKQTTVQSLETIILYLAEYGYTFHRLDDIW